MPVAGVNVSSNAAPVKASRSYLDVQFETPAAQIRVHWM